VRAGAVADWEPEPTGSPSLAGTRLATVISFWFGGSAWTAEPGTSDLNQILTDPKDFQRYLTAVKNMLVELSDKIATKSKLSDEQKSIYRQIVFTAVWQESCRRQYVTKGTPLASATEDLDLMQVNRRDLTLLPRQTRHPQMKTSNGRELGPRNLFRLQRWSRRAGPLSRSKANSHMEKSRRSFLGEIQGGKHRERDGRDKLLPKMNRFLSAPATGDPHA
jgi:hypothetical protein